MKLERLIGILMILLNKGHVTAKELSQRFAVSIRTIQRDIDSLSVAGIPVTAATGPGGGYSLLEEYTLHKNFLRKEEMQLLNDVLGGLGKLLSQARFTDIREKLNVVSQKSDLFGSGTLRFDFMPWLPPFNLEDKLNKLSEAITARKCLEIDYRDQKGESSHRIVEPYQLVMKDYAWYLYGYCLTKRDFRYFKVLRITSILIKAEGFEPRPLPEPAAFLDFSDRLIDIRLKFSMKAIGRIEDYFSEQDVQYGENCIIVTTRYPEDKWLYQTLRSFGKEVEVLAPLHIRERLRQEAAEIARMYSEQLEDNPS
ncbi:MAG: YafY family transcriptional regulator [Clostridia bacterium]|nr:YafY family transcriptional regulator [Clostridia bacterium]